MSTYRPGDPTEVKSRRQLVEYFAPQTAERGRLGLEWEQLPVDAGSRLVPFAGPSGVESALGRIAQGHEAVLERGRITALRLVSGGMVGLEPGSQVEIASPPLGSLDSLHRFLAISLGEVDGAARERGFRLVPWGVAPHNGPEDLPDVPKARYGMLRKHLLDAGPRGRLMMKVTASIQVNVDYEGEGDMRAKLAAALILSPYLVSFTANSPVFLGRRSRWLSQRPWIWRGTDPRRCGLPRFLFSESTGYEAFARYGLSRPVLFLVRGGRYVRGDGRTFQEWWRNPGKAGPLTLGDWALHLSTLFPDLRLRRGYLEVRTLDTLPLSLTVAVAALLKGLLCDPEALRAWTARMPGVPEARAARRMVLDAARLGPRWVPDKGPGPVEALTLLLEASSRGLASLGEEDSLLAPMRELVGRAACPADLWRKDASGVWRGPEDPAPVF